MCSVELAHEWLKVWGEYRRENPAEHCYEPRSSIVVKAEWRKTVQAGGRMPVRLDVELVCCHVDAVERAVKGLAPTLREIIVGKYAEGLSDRKLLEQGRVRVAWRELPLLRKNALELVAARLARKNP